MVNTTTMYVADIMNGQSIFIILKYVNENDQFSIENFNLYFPLERRVYKVFDYEANDIPSLVNIMLNYIVRCETFLNCKTFFWNNTCLKKFLLNAWENCTLHVQPMYEVDMLQIVNFNIINRKSDVTYVELPSIYCQYFDSAIYLQTWKAIINLLKGNLTQADFQYIKFINN
jgi:hypothetical protein